MSQMTKALVLYHDNCPDGFTAAWAVWKALGDEALYAGVNYGQEPVLSACEGRRVILVDFSYPRAQLDRIGAVAERVEVYDHHKTAEEALRYWGDEAPETRRVVFDMNRSGAGIAWDEFHPGGPTWLGVRPPLVSYAEDMDLWRFALPYSREIREVIFLTERTFAAWNDLNDSLVADFPGRAQIGAALLQAKRVRVATVCKNVRWLTFGEHRIPVVNASWDMSELGEYLAEQYPDAPCGGYYFDRADARQWGFRSRNGFDVSALCKQYGGGGHAAAAGFQSEIGWLP